MRVHTPYGPRRPIDLERFKFPPQPHYTLHDGCCDYASERLINKGKDCKRAWTGFNLMMAECLNRSFA